MLYSKLRQRIKGIRNNKGVALVVILMVFLVTIILGTSAASIVFSDNMFSIHQKESKQAYYAARSAISVVEAAIIEEVKAQKEKADLVLAASTPEQLIAAQIDYEAVTNRLMGDGADITVLPNVTKDSVRHKIVLSSNQFDIDEDPDEILVDVGYRPDGTYLIEAKATVNGTESKASRILYLNSVPQVKSITQAAIAFKNALYAHQDITSKTSQGSAITTVNGTASWGYGFPKPNLTYGMTGQDSTITQDMYGERGPDQSPTLTSADTMFERIAGSGTLGSGTLPVPKKVSGKNVYDLTAANSGVFTSLDLDGTYNADTTAGDVVLKISYADFTNNVNFKITQGTNHLIIYVVDSVGDGNNLTFEGRSHDTSDPNASHSDIMFILGDGVDKFAQNNIMGKYFYIYAPHSELEIDNNIGGVGSKADQELGLVGAIIANSIYVGNGGTITYKAPNDDLLEDFGDMYASGSAITLTVNTYTESSLSYWLK